MNRTSVPLRTAAFRHALALSMFAACVGFTGGRAHAQTRAFPKAVLTYPTPMDPDDIAGIVTSLNGPEAGVWVIAEAMASPAQMVRIVVTDDDGRYVLPDMPKAAYQVFVRGHGLEDSQRSKAWPGQQLFFGVKASPNSNPTPRPTGTDRNVVVTMWNENAENQRPPEEAAGDSMSVAWTVPYPAAFVVRSVEEHIEDSTTGWKGRGQWATVAGKVLKFQIRPNPLAR